MKRFSDELRQMQLPARGRLLIIPVSSRAGLQAVVRALATWWPEATGMVVCGPGAAVREDSLRRLALEGEPLSALSSLEGGTVLALAAQVRPRRPDVALVVYEEPGSPARWGQVLGLLSGAGRVWTLALSTAELSPGGWGRLAASLAAKARASLRETADGIPLLGAAFVRGERWVATAARRAIARAIVGPPGRLADARVLLVWSHRGASTRYRIHHKAEQLRLLGLQATVRQFTDYAARPGLAVRDAARHHVAILHRVPRPSLVAPLLDSLRRFGRPVIYDVDDLIFDPTVAAFVPPSTRQAIRAQAALLSLATHVFAPTSELSARAAGPGRPAFTIRNVLGEATLEEALRARRPGPRGSAISFGYLSGSPTHDADLASIGQTLARTLEKHPHTRLVLVGPVAVPPVLSPLSDRVETLPLIAWRDLPALMAEKVEVNLAPLDVENPFCRAKSELKYFEAGVLGIPTIASPTPAFREAIRHGENGLLAAIPGEWEDALDQMATRPELIVHLGEAARQDVLNRYTPQAGAQALAAALGAVLGVPSPETATRFPPSADPSG